MRAPTGTSGAAERPSSLSSTNEELSIAYLAKGYTDWAIGPKLADVPKEELEELTAITVEIFQRWHAAEMAE